MVNGSYGEENQEITEEELIRECNQLGRDLTRQMPGVSAVIVTLGKHGVLLVEPSLGSRHFAVQPEANIVSVSGAGDCLSAGFIAGILHGHDHHNSLKMGLKAARLSLQTMDTVPQNLTLSDIL